jgi:hypothetical protein
MATSIVQIIASVLGYLAARGIDQIVGKWVAYFEIAWEKVATKKAMDTYRETKNTLVIDMAEKWKEWDDWRKSQTKVE